jgi:hypothetical protein
MALSLVIFEFPYTQLNNQEISTSKVIDPLPIHYFATFIACYLRTILSGLLSG